MNDLSSALNLYVAEDGSIAVNLREVHSATLQDLLDCWQPLCDDPGIYKRYATGHYAACKACEQNCCGAADISPDLISLRRLSKGLGLSIPDFLTRFCEPDLLTHGLIKVQSNPCIFLRENICTVYPWRTLLCLFYICSEIEASAQELIYRCSLLGAAAAHRYAREQGLIPGAKPEGLGTFDRSFLTLMEQQMHHSAVDYFLSTDDYAAIPLRILLET